MTSRKKKGVESLKRRYGLMFISPWIIGLLLFFIIPIFKSIYYCFCNATIGLEGLKIDFIKFENFDYILNKHPNYISFLTESIAKIAYSLPVIVIVSLIIALVLNQKFRGRAFFRALYFLPVIIASGVVMELLFEVNTADVSSIGMDESVSSNMIDFKDIILKLGIPAEISGYISAVFENIFELIWNSGIQIILFIAGMQSIPDLLYEVAKVEGCTKWEEFWYITLPMLSRVIVLVFVFTTVELLTAKNNVLMSLVIQTINNLEYGVGAAMAWVYFIVIGFILAGVMFLINNLWLKRWR